MNTAEKRDMPGELMAGALRFNTAEERDTDKERGQKIIWIKTGQKKTKRCRR